MRRVMYHVLMILARAGGAAKIVGPSTKLALLQGFARNLTGPLRLSGGPQLPQQAGETPARAQPAQQRHAMSQLSPRGGPVSSYVPCRVLHDSQLPYTGLIGSHQVPLCARMSYGVARWIKGFLQ